MTDSTKRAAGGESAVGYAWKNGLLRAIRTDISVDATA